MIHGLQLLKNDEVLFEEGLFQRTRLDKQMSRLLNAAKDTVKQYLMGVNGSFVKEGREYQDLYESLLGTSQNDLEYRAIKRDHDLFVEQMGYISDFCYLNGMKDSFTGSSKKWVAEGAEEDILGLDLLYDTEKYKGYMVDQEKSWDRLQSILSEPQKILYDAYREQLTFMNYETWVHMYITGYEWGMSMVSNDEGKNAYLRKLYKRYDISK